VTRPPSIVMFERLYIAVIVIGIANTVLRWPTVRETALAQPGAEALPDWFVPVTMAIAIAINIAFWYFIARRGSNVVRWIYAVLTVVGVLGVAFTLISGALFADPIGGTASIVSTALSIICVWLIFRPDAQPWFQKDRRDLGDTFS
jgi:hypothetical protein